MRGRLLALALLLGTPVAAAAFAVGDTVKVVNTNSLNVRVCPAGTVLGTQPWNTLGVIIGGTGALVNSYHRWQVNFATGADGCVAQEYLQLVSGAEAIPPSPEPVPIPPPPGGSGDQIPGTWVKLEFPTASIDQPLLGGDQTLAPGQPGAAYTTCPRPIQTNGAGIFRSFSGVLIANGELWVNGGGHGGHPGNDLLLVDYVTAARVAPYVAECPPPYLADGTLNPLWRAIKGGAVMTGGFSPTGKPWVQHLYMNHVWDSIRSRYLMVNGNGLMAYTVPSAAHPDGQWALLAGRNKYAGEVVWGSSGALIFDDVRDSVWLFVSSAGNGAARGIYEYLFDAAGDVIVKRYVRPWPATPDYNWAYNLMTALYAPERREAILIVTPSSTTSYTGPPNRIWRFNLDAASAPTWDQTWMPGMPQYDEVFAVDDTRARNVTRLPGQIWLKLRTGAWIQEDAHGGAWRWLPMPGAPDLAWWTFACDPDSPYCVGLTTRSLYGPIGTSSGGISDLWRYRRP